MLIRLSACLAEVKPNQAGAIGTIQYRQCAESCESEHDSRCGSTGPMLKKLLSEDRHESQAREPLRSILRVR